MILNAEPCVVINVIGLLTLNSSHHSQEDPFGDDESDLPLEKFCKEVEKQITAVDERAKLITYDLAYGPASHMPVAVERKGSYIKFSSSHGSFASSTYQGSLASSYQGSLSSSANSSETDRLIS